MKNLRYLLPVIASVVILVATGCDSFLRESNTTYSPHTQTATQSAPYESPPISPRLQDAVYILGDTYGEDSPASYEGIEALTDLEDSEGLETESDEYPSASQYVYIISATWATPEALGSHEAFEAFSEHSQGYERIIISSGTVITNFRYIALGLNEEHFYFYEAQALYSLEEMIPERPLIVNWQETGPLPHRGVAFVDTQGANRYFFITTDISYEHLILVEFWPGVSVMSG